MKILAMDTSNRAMSVAVMVDGELLAESTLNHKKTHSEQLLPTIDRLMTVSGLEPADLDRVVVADGPGSYTGVRIAVTTAKTLADTLKLALVGVSSLAVMAAGVTWTTNLIVPVMDARRQNVFAGVYQWLNGELINVVEDRHLALAELLQELKLLRQPSTFVGSDVAKFADPIKATLGASAHFVDSLSNLPQAGRLALLGANKSPVDVTSFVPRYLRLTEAETNWLKTHDDKGHAPYVQKV
ncbi:tRNA (adenosine(37)-N6)-threonylcarbamoyltransferase complex dimerization subunit type 1 TsaB [Lacticaseibacillus camelliae]|uniref:Metal-dependent protease-like protein, putative molecular chaperone n=1 Tax=Lacticaseibacillus camelliae DSM 22697 = JCM 13995 TaxID=1423730 RepID=A0A0R2F5N3_9LACO|nr:tRNA (adenosine(37)-N6)-threonylcarbamoyltransferase complex dimerization subunit type 1 TsaB [Lacticaseibacillus camelliae]KRN23014.1 metal-dependent protease-like protein, putative molecular chaperone [Lacticaseibacillus camelliae DSM 22697 = JCM 13995]